MCEHGIEICQLYYIRKNTDKEWKPLVLDVCLSEITKEIHSVGILTYGSCCGHYNYCGGFIIDSHSVYKALRNNYNISREWMVNSETGNEFIVWHLNLLNNCENCRANIDPICPCPCSCHIDALFESNSYQIGERNR